MMNSKRAMQNLWLSGLRVMLFLAGGLLLAQAAIADERQTDKQKRSSEKSNRPVHVYKLEFTVDEFVEGKRVNTRTFTMMMKEHEASRVRMGTKLLAAAPGAEAKYLDIGLKFDCEIEERDELIVFDGKLDLNDLPPAEEGKTALPSQIRNFQAEVETAFPLDKNTVLGVYEDSASKRRYELRATVSKVKGMLASQ